MFIHRETHIEGWSHKSGNKQAKKLRVADSGGWENGKLLFSSSGFSGFAFFLNFPPNKNRKVTVRVCWIELLVSTFWVYCGSMWLPHPWRVKGPRVSSSVLSSSLFKLRPVLISFSLMALNNQPRPLSRTPDSYISNCPLTSAGECPKRHLKFKMSKIELLIPLFSKAQTKKTTQHLHLSKWQLCVSNGSGQKPWSRPFSHPFLSHPTPNPSGNSVDSTSKTHHESDHFFTLPLQPAQSKP